MRGLIFILIVGSLFAVLMGVFVFSNIQAEWNSKTRQDAIFRLPIDELVHTVKRAEPFDTLQAAMREAGFYIGWDDHWPSWGFGVNAPGDPGHLLWEFKAVPRKLCTDTPTAEASCAKRFAMTENRLAGRLAAANAREQPPLRRALLIFSRATGIEVEEDGKLLYGQDFSVIR